MIVVEGPDGGGKSTLVQALTSMTGWPVMPRRVGQDTEALVDIKDWVEEDNNTLENYRIYDRHALISEPIYGSILRYKQKPCFTDRHWYNIQLQLFYGRLPIIIYCLPPVEVVIENVINDPSNAAVAQKIEGIYAAYVARSAIDRVKNINTFVYDYTFHTPSAIESMWHHYLTNRTYSDSAR